MNIHKVPTLTRYSNHPIMGSHGELVIPGRMKCFTLECAWEYNLPFSSCVPLGLYEIVEVSSEKYGICLALHNPTLGVYANYKDVPKSQRGTARYRCLFHAANVVSELQGCCALGSALGYYKRQWSVSKSGDTLSKAYEHLKEAGRIFIKGTDF